MIYKAMEKAFLLLLIFSFIVLHVRLGMTVFGYIPFETLINIIYHPALKDVPKILETPYVTASDDSKVKVYPPYLFEIKEIRNKEKNINLIEDIRKFYNKD